MLISQIPKNNHFGMIMLYTDVMIDYIVHKKPKYLMITTYMLCTCYNYLLLIILVIKTLRLNFGGFVMTYSIKTKTNPCLKNTEKVKISKINIILSVISSKMLKRNDEKNVENTNSDSLVSKLSVALQGEYF